MDEKINKIKADLANYLAGPLFPLGYYAVIALLHAIPENEGYKLDFKRVQALLNNAGLTTTRTGNMVTATYPSGEYMLTLHSYRNSNALEVLFGRVDNPSKSIGLATLARHLQLRETPDQDPLYPRFEVNSEEGLEAAINYLKQIAA